MSAGLINNEAAINDALRFAKELNGSSNSTLKRSIPEDSDSLPAKRANMDNGASVISTLGGLGGMVMGGYGGNGGMSMGNPHENVVEVIIVPDNSVGLVIGKGGSEITQIQAQSGARVQMAPESTGDGTRQCTLQGTKMAVERAKQLIHDVITRANARRAGGGSLDNGSGGINIQLGPNAITYDMLIPGTKCGLIIGKAGETIRQLQEQSGVKMMMIQDNTEAGGAPKPLRMNGDPERIEIAKKLVQDLLNSRNDEGGVIGGGGGMGGMMGGGGGMMGGGGQGGLAKGEVVVPRSSVGMIIGKGGDTIKRLAMETGTKIQFKPDDPSQQDRCAVIQGTREQIYKATELITELVQRSCAQSGPQVQDTFYMHVPANKTGLVIGKGGETIKQICTESGAHCELSRDPPPNSAEKVFVIKGTAYQIHHAQHIIRIKVGDIAPGTPVPPFQGMGGGSGGAPSFGGGPFNGGGGGGPFGMGGGGGPQYGQTFPDQSNGWNGGGMQQAQPYFQQQQPQWAEYYRNMGMHDQAAKIEAQMRGGGGAAAGGPSQQVLHSNSSVTHRDRSINRLRERTIDVILM
uniref:K Homology domain containing protein n=1 Tax=Pristionchus pacificus TaxID=54126 RepID=A0A2A6BFL3_PRIPA|eukprot:PDM64656.1 K Homology domain containing protein [Pristionchus pacificus]